jgi:prepilin-type N-terminal cleavage/methylation domain-containing protein
MVMAKRLFMTNLYSGTTTAKRSTSAGFTIIEMLVTTVIFGIAIVMLTGLFSLIQDAQRSAIYFSVATHAARSEVDRLRSSGFASITNGNSYPFTGSLPTTLPTGSTATVVVAATGPTNAPDSKKIDVTVSYPIGGLTKNVTISAYVDPPEPMT